MNYEAGDTLDERRIAAGIEKYLRGDLKLVTGE